MKYKIKKIVKYLIKNINNNNNKKYNGLSTK